MMAPMNGTTDDCEFEARPAASAYIVLTGPSFLVALFSGVVAWMHPERGTQALTAIVVSVAFLWVVWLRGFRIRLTGEHIEYRDGLYRRVIIPWEAINEVKHTWVEWSILGRRLQIPCLMIAYGNGNNFVRINSKPFRRQDLRALSTILHNIGDRKN
jgi:hypothetical protein